MKKKRGPGRPKKKQKISQEDRRDFAWLNRKLGAVLKKWGLTTMSAKEQTENSMFNGPKRRYD